MSSHLSVKETVIFFRYFSGQRKRQNGVFVLTTPRFVGTSFLKLSVRISPAIEPSSAVFFFADVLLPSRRQKRSTVRIPRKTHLRYTHVYMGISLTNSTENERSHADQDWIHPIVERPCLNYTTGSSGLASVRHHRELKSKELDRHS